jgi:hypothetical protein
VGDSAVAGPTSRLRVEMRGEAREPRPYIHIRGGLEARISRSVFYELVNLAEEIQVPGGRELGVWSDGVFFVLGSPDS